SGGSEIDNAAVDDPLEHERSIAQRAVGDDNGRATNGIVCNLVPDQNTQGIGASVVFYRKSDHRFRVTERGARSRCFAIRQPLEPWPINCRNSVLSRATGFDLCEWHAVLGEIRTRPFQAPADGISQ